MHGIVNRNSPCSRVGFLITRLSLRSLPGGGIVLALRDWGEDLLPAETDEVIGSNQTASEVLLDESRSRLAEDDVDLLESLVLGLGHEEDLVYPTEDSNATIEAEGETNPGHAILHAGEEVGDKEGAEEEGDVRSLHTVRSEVGWVDFGWENPSETGIGTEEPFVNYESSDVDSLGGGLIADWDQVTASNHDETNEETG